jgi:hypothetical protein
MVPIARSGIAEHRRFELAARLRGRHGEIEQAVLTRVHAVEDPQRKGHEYTRGLRAAVCAAIEYGLAAIEMGEERAPPPPPALLAQARMAAHSGVSLDTVLRRYFAGHALLGDFLIDEAESEGAIGAAALQGLLRTQAIVFDRLLSAISEEHGREAPRLHSSDSERRAERVERLLAGELVNTSGLLYDFEAHHLAIIGAGPGALEAIRSLAGALDRRLLFVPRPQGIFWAWLGSSRPLDLRELERRARADLPDGPKLAAGAPGEGPAGWRLSHRQAHAALPIALRSSESLVRYQDVALLASVLQDELLGTSLREFYLAPLECERDGGETLRRTLEAYFATERNASSAAARLGVSRQAVAKRLNSVERRLGLSISRYGTDIEIALRLESLSALTIANT